MNEPESYQTIYGELLYVIPHYRTRLGWVYYAVVSDGKCYINGKRVEKQTLEAMLRGSAKRIGNEDEGFGIAVKP